MMAFLEFTFRSLPHFIGIGILLVIVGMTIETVMENISSIFRRK